MGVVGNWKQLREEIRSFPDRMTEKDQQLTEALYRYRFQLTQLSFKPQRIDHEVWSAYDGITRKAGELAQRSTGRLMLPPGKLKEIHQDWQELLAAIDELLDFLNEASEGAAFYDKMETAKDRKREREAVRAVEDERVREAKRSLIRSIHYVVLRERGEDPVTLGSVLLDMDDAVNVWIERLQQVISMEAEIDIEVDELITHIEGLRKQIIETSFYAEKVKRVEDHLDETLSLEEELQAFGKTVIAEIELYEILALLQEDVPACWAQGQWESLSQHLDTVERFARRSESMVRSELYVSRKRGLAVGKRPSPASAPKAPEAESDQEREISTNEGMTPQPSAVSRDELEAKLREIAALGEGAPDPDGDRGSNKGETRLEKSVLDPDVDASVRIAFERSENGVVRGDQPGTAGEDDSGGTA